MSNAATVSGAEDQLLTVPEVARRFSVRASWVYARTEDGTLPSFKIGRYVRFRAADIEHYLETQRRRQ